MRIASSELILREDGSIYHLKLKPGQISDTIITVGDPDRVNSVTQHFDEIELEVQTREFKTVTGHYKGKRLTVISTGIGTDNIDIVFNELDALVNVDFETRTVKDQLRSLKLIRIGTSGTMQEEWMDSWNIINMKLQLILFHSKSRSLILATMLVHATLLYLIILIQIF